MGASGVDISGIAGAMDMFFWSLLGRAASMPAAELNQSIDSATHLIYHAIFSDSAGDGLSALSRRDPLGVW